MTNEPGTNDQTGHPAEATGRQSPHRAAAQKPQPDHFALAELELNRAARQGDDNPGAEAYYLSAAQTHAVLALVQTLRQNQEPAATTAGEPLYTLDEATEAFRTGWGSAARNRRLTVERRRIEGVAAYGLRKLEEPLALSNAREGLVSALGLEEDGRALIARFEAAVRADQREKDAVIAEASADDELPGYDSDLPGAVAEFAASRIRNSGSTPEPRT